MHKLMHINWDSIRVVCKDCHRIISYAERTGMTFEEAKLEKEVIAFTKLSIKVQDATIHTLAIKLAVNYNCPTNAKQRRAVYKKLLQEKL